MLRFNPIVWQFVATYSQQVASGAYCYQEEDSPIDMFSVISSKYIAEISCCEENRT